MEVSKKREQEEEKSEMEGSKRARRGGKSMKGKKKTFTLKMNRVKYKTAWELVSAWTMANYLYNIEGVLKPVSLNLKEMEILYERVDGNLKDDFKSLSSENFEFYLEKIRDTVESLKKKGVIYSNIEASNINFTHSPNRVMISNFEACHLIPREISTEPKGKNMYIYLNDTVPCKDMEKKKFIIDMIVKMYFSSDRTESDMLLCITASHILAGERMIIPFILEKIENQDWYRKVLSSI